MIPERLQRAVRNGSVFHAYLLEGPRRETEALAQAFAAAVLCSRQDGSICGECVSCRQIRDGVSPYIFQVRTLEESDADLGEEKKSGKKAKAKDSGKIRDGQIEDVIERSRGNALGSSRIITIIEQADTITPRGQNRLLKVLEEPPEGMMIILMTENSEGLLETIRSRCQLVRPAGNGEELPDEGNAFLKRAVAAAAGMLAGVPAADLWKEIEYFSDTREKAMHFAETAQLFYRDLILYGETGRKDLLALRNFEPEILAAAEKADRQSVIRAAEACERAIRDLKAIVSMKHALRYMMFDIQLFHGDNMGIINNDNNSRRQI